MTVEKGKIDPALEDLLVSYLDGELDDAEMHRVEDMLANDPKILSALKRLQRTWDMLDELEKPSTDNSFTRSTMEMVALAAKEDLQQSLVESPILRRRQQFYFWGLLLLALTVGFTAMAAVLPNPNAMLLNYYPIIENLYAYEQVRNIDYLKQLHDLGTFNEELDESSDAGASAAVSTNDSYEGRQQAIVNKNSSEKADLANRVEKFEKMQPAKQKELKELYEQLQRDPQRVELEKTMSRYYKWVVELRQSDRAVLENLRSTNKERIKYVEEQLKNQPFLSISKADADGLEKFFLVIRERMHKQFMEAEKQQQAARAKQGEKTQQDGKSERDKADRPEDHSARGDRDRDRRPGGPPRDGSGRDEPRQRGEWRGSVMTPAQYEEIKSYLSDNTRKILEKHTPEEQRELIDGLLGQFFSLRMRKYFGGNKNALDQDKELADILDKQKPDVKDTLMKLSPEQLRYKLRELYYFEKGRPLESPSMPMSGGPDGMRGPMPSDFHEQDMSRGPSPFGPGPFGPGAMGWEPGGMSFPPETETTHYPWMNRNMSQAYPFLGPSSNKPSQNKPVDTKADGKKAADSAESPSSADAKPDSTPNHHE